jgi:hypothetical protein
MCAVVYCFFCCCRCRRRCCCCCCRDLQTNPEPSGASVLESILLAVFLADIVVSFFVGYYDESGLLVLDNRRVSTHYLRCARCICMYC